MYLYKSNIFFKKQLHLLLFNRNNKLIPVQSLLFKKHTETTEMKEQARMYVYKYKNLTFIM